MPSEATEREVNQSGDHQQPCCFKMKIAAPSILVRERVSISGGHHVAGRRNRDLEQRLRVYVPSFAPIEPRMRNEDFPSRDKQRRERNQREPMRDANKCCMPRLA